jgi:hypothetical protein
VAAALESGALDQQRYDNYRKVQADLKKLGKRQEEKESMDEQRRRNTSRTKRLKHS